MIKLISNLCPLNRKLIRKLFKKKKKKKKKETHCISVTPTGTELFCQAALPCFVMRFGAMGVMHTLTN